jgi:hypothetical protein
LPLASTPVLRKNSPYIPTFCFLRQLPHMSELLTRLLGRIYNAAPASFIGTYDESPLISRPKKLRVRAKKPGVLGFSRGAEQDIDRNFWPNSVSEGSVKDQC